MALLDWFKKKEKADQELIEEGVCPNCWGYQEYQGEIKEVARNRQIDINNKDATATRAFVQDFVVNHIQGIRLHKEGDGSVCLKCKGRYR